MFERSVGQIEMYSLDKHVCTDEDFFIAVIQDSGIIAYSFYSRRVFYVYGRSEVVNQPELSKGR